MLTQLTRLALRDHWVGDEGVAALTCLTGLRSLCLAGNSNRISTQGLALLAATMTQLEDLNLSLQSPLWCSHGSKLAPLSNLGRLTSLDLSYSWQGSDCGEAGAGATGGAEPALGWLGQLKALQHFEAGGNPLSPELCPSLAALTQLTHVGMSSVIYESDASVAVFLPTLAGLPLLRALDVSSNLLAASDCVLLTALTSLTHLSVAFNQLGWGGSGADAARILAAMTHLRSLHADDNRWQPGNVKGNCWQPGDLVALTALTGLTKLTYSDSEVCHADWQLLRSALGPRVVPRWTHFG